MDKDRGLATGESLPEPGTRADSRWGTLARRSERRGPREHVIVIWHIAVFDTRIIQDQ